MALSTEQITLISRQVYRQFPEMKGQNPNVQTQPAAKTVGAASGRFLLTYKGRGAGPGGRSIPRIVRVVTDERGKVIKITTSR